MYFLTTPLNYQRWILTIEIFVSYNYCCWTEGKFPSHHSIILQYKISRPRRYLYLVRFALASRRSRWFPYISSSGGVSKCRTDPSLFHSHCESFQPRTPRMYSITTFRWVVGKLLTCCKKYKTFSTYTSITYITWQTNYIQRLPRFQLSLQ